MNVDEEPVELTRKERRLEEQAEKRTQRVERLLVPLKAGAERTFGKLFGNLELAKGWITILMILFITFLLVLTNYHSIRIEEIKNR